MRLFLPFFPLYLGAFPLHARCAGGSLSPYARCIGALSPIVARRVVSTLFLHERCTGGVLRPKNEALRPFSKVDEVEVHTYHLGEVAFGS